MPTAALPREGGDLKALFRRLLTLTFRIVVIGFSGFVFLLTLLVVSCRPVPVPEMLPSPDRRVSLMVVQYYEGITAPGYTEVYLVGKDAAEPVKLGNANHRWNPLSFGWVDDTTLNACPLRGDPNALRRVEVVTEDGRRQTYKVTTDCAPGMYTDDKDAGPLHGYDYSAVPRPLAS